jgi:pheromone shutdown protein TraB
MQNKKKILAIIGAGHEREVLELIKDREAVTYSFSIKNK